MKEAIKATNGWWKFAVGLLIGALAPSLIAWGSMTAKIEANKEGINSKVSIATFDEYKRGCDKLHEEIRSSLRRIESKVDSIRN